MGFARSKIKFFRFYDRQSKVKANFFLKISTQKFGSALLRAFFNLGAKYNTVLCIIERILRIISRLATKKYYYSQTTCPRIFFSSSFFASVLSTLHGTTREQQALSMCIQSLVPISFILNLNKRKRISVEPQ